VFDFGMMATLSQPGTGHRGRRNDGAIGRTARH
jgi:hypothetical protein